MKDIDKVHLQGWVSKSNMATVLNWIMEQGNSVSNRSKLVETVFEIMADSIVDGGGRPIVGDEEIAMVIKHAWDRQKRITLAAPTPHAATQQGAYPPSGSREEKLLFEEALRKAQALAQHAAQVDDGGEFDADALRQELAAQELRKA